MTNSFMWVNAWIIGNYLTLVLLNILRCHAHLYFHPIWLLDPDFCYKFAYLMANSADPDQKPTDLDLHCLQNRVYPGSAGQGLTVKLRTLFSSSFFSFFMAVA